MFYPEFTVSLLQASEIKWVIWLLCTPCGFCPLKTLRLKSAQSTANLGRKLRRPRSVWTLNSFCVKEPQMCILVGRWMGMRYWAFISSHKCPKAIYTFGNIMSIWKKNCWNSWMAWGNETHTHAHAHTETHTHRQTHQFARQWRIQCCTRSRTKIWLLREPALLSQNLSCIHYFSNLCQTIYKYVITHTSLTVLQPQN